MSLRKLALAAFSGSLLTFSAAGAAPAHPDPVPVDGPDTRPCFLEPFRWNEAVDGPIPRCPTWAALHAAPTIVLRRDLPVP